jgi:hypothetical protein
MSSGYFEGKFCFFAHQVGIAGSSPSGGRRRNMPGQGCVNAAFPSAACGSGVGSAGGDLESVRGGCASRASDRLAIESELVGGSATEDASSMRGNTRTWGRGADERLNFFGPRYWHSRTDGDWASRRRLGETGIVSRRRRRRQWAARRLKVRRSPFTSNVTSLRPMRTTVAPFTTSPAYTRLPFTIAEGLLTP